MIYDVKKRIQVFLGMGMIGPGASMFSGYKTPASVIAEINTESESNLFFSKLRGQLADARAWYNKGIRTRSSDVKKLSFPFALLQQSDGKGEGRQNCSTDNAEASGATGASLAARTANFDGFDGDVPSFTTVNV